MADLTDAEVCAASKLVTLAVGHHCEHYRCGRPPAYRLRNLDFCVPCCAQRLRDLQHARALTCRPDTEEGRRARVRAIVESTERIHQRSNHEHHPEPVR